LEIILLVAGIILGTLIGYLISKSRSQVLVTKMEEKASALDKANLDLGSSRAEILELNKELSKSHADFANLNTRLSEQKKDLEEINTRFKVEFENIANSILDDKSRKFTEQNRENLDIILNPLKDKIDEFKGKVEKVYKDESDERNVLRGEINKLIDLNKQISEEAENLTRALKGDIRKQGNWGELILEKILERSGLVKEREYKLHYNAVNTDGKRLQPDVVVFLPDNKHIIVDSKVSLTAYERYTNSDNVNEKAQFLKEHMSSLKAHIKGLSEKNYQASEKFNTPDFVLLFMPIESSFSLVVETDVDLFSYAWERKVQIVTPSTLLISLLTIASLWQREKQSTFAVEIADIAGNIYDKFELMIKDLIDVGRKINQMQGSYEDVMRKLHSGRGNLVSQVEKMKRLGANTKKSLPKQLLDRAGEENGDDDESDELKLFQSS
jgi:DNA recombination protein RmuC